MRALRPLADDRALLSAINHGEFAIHGFRNRDLRAIFFRSRVEREMEAELAAHTGTATTVLGSSWTMIVYLLQAHALITKIVGTHRYQLTSSGRRIIVAILSALRSTVAQLTPVTAQLTAVAA